MTQHHQRLAFVLPGDNVTEWIPKSNLDFSSTKGPSKQKDESTKSKTPRVVKLGTGLRWDKNGIKTATIKQNVHATLAGQLMYNPTSHTVYIQSNGGDKGCGNAGRYHPMVNDRVVVIVEDRMGSDGATGGDLYRCTMGAGHTATLSNLAFEGATKRNKPVLQPGQVLYARIAALSDHLDVELSCQLSPTVDVGQHGLERRDWMTDEGCYGILHGGTVLRLAQHDWIRQSLLPNVDHVVWQELAAAAAAPSSGSATSFAGEVAVGANGWIWMHAAHPAATVALYNIFRNATVFAGSEAQTRAMIRQIIFQYHKQMQQQFDAMEEG